jgi:hypothetical protein
MTLEKCLRQIGHKAALLRHFADSAALNPAIPDPSTLSGLGDVCGDIGRLAQAAKAVLSVDALGVEVRDPL